MLSHSNAFIPKMNDENRQCFDDYEGQLFSIELQIAVAPGALQSPDSKDLEDQIYHLLFSGNSYGCINLEKSADFYLAVKSTQNNLLYETRHKRSEETPDVLWDERRLWLDQKDEYLIEISLDDRSGKTHGFWYWLQDSDAGFWNDVEIKGFLHCGIDYAVAACFRKGGGNKDVFVTTLDLPSENENWFEGTYEADSMTSDWFSMSIDVLNQGLWDRILPSAFQIAAVNQIDQEMKAIQPPKVQQDIHASRCSTKRNLSLLEKITDARSPEKAAKDFSSHVIRFYPIIEVRAGGKYLLEQSIREILQLLSKTDAGCYRAQTYTGFFYNKASLYLEIWDFNPDTFELVISHTVPLA